MKGLSIYTYRSTLEFWRRMVPNKYMYRNFFFNLGEKKEIWVGLFSFLIEKSIGGIYFSLSNKWPVGLFGTLEYVARNVTRNLIWQHTIENDTFFHFTLYNIYL